MNAYGFRLAAVALACAVAASCAQESPSPGDAVGDRLRGALQTLVDEGDLPGAVVLIAGDGEIVAQAVAGSRDIAAHKPMTEDTIFRLYSMSKPIASVAVMMLVEEGLLSLDMPVERLLPELSNLRVYEAGGVDDMTTVPAARSITIDDLLTHRSGITYHFTGATPVHQYYRKYGVMRDTPVGRTPEDGPPARSLDELVERLGHAPLLHQPGAEFAYSYSTTVLGAVIERATGMTLDAALEDLIFAPLGMTDTGFFIPDADLDRFVTNYAMSDGALIEIEAPETSDYRDRSRLLDGGGAIAGTARDYMRFAQMLANGGELDGVRLLSPESLDLMVAPHVVVDSVIGKFTFGYGFQIGDAASAESGQLPADAVGWSGSGNTFFWVRPGTGDAVVFMTQVILGPDSAETGRRFRSVVNDIAEDALAE